MTNPIKRTGTFLYQLDDAGNPVWTAKVEMANGPFADALRMAVLFEAAPKLLESLQNLVGLARLGAAPLRDYKAALEAADEAIAAATKDAS